MTTASDLVEEARSHLLSGQREERNVLSAPITATDTSLTLTYSSIGVTRGAVLSIDLELLYVWAINGSTVTVERGFGGSTAATHAANAPIGVNHRFPRFAILRAINEELNALSSPRLGLFRIVTVDVTYNAATAGYDLTGATDVLDIAEVRAMNYGPLNDWPLIRGFRLVRDMPVTSFPSGFGIIVDSGNPGLPIRVRYRSTFRPLTALTDDVQVVSGLPASANDIPPLGAAIRLVAPREFKRAFTEAQGDTRRPEEVPPGATVASMRGMMSVYQDRVKQEADRLAARYPIMLRG